MWITPTSLYHNKTLRQLDAYVINQGLMSEETLMQHAAAATLEAILSKWPAVRRMVIFCGKGNNAGDGYTLAKLALAKGLMVQVVAVANPDSLSGIAQAAWQACVDALIPIHPFTTDLDIAADVMVDALLGSGISGEVAEPFASAIRWLNQNATPTVAIDIPSGLDPDLGGICGVAVKAQLTVTFYGYRQGLFTHEGPALCGEIRCNDLNAPIKDYPYLESSAELLQWSEVKAWLPRRSRTSNKGHFGHVLVIGGDYGMGGAVRMAAEAAMRVGAGLVTVATRPEHVPVVSGSRPELMCYQVCEAQDLEPLIARATVVVLGPGLGQSDWAKALFDKVMQSKLPKVLDADGLNLLAEHRVKRDDFILTPHPGEAARLLKQTRNEVQRDRFKSVELLQYRYHGIAVLKGAGTIIQITDEKPWVCGAGNPGMATGGMGDILSGMIGGLVAQGLTLPQAAKAGVLIHAMAADRAVEDGGGERGLLATDLLAHLRYLVNPTSTIK